MKYSFLPLAFLSVSLVGCNLDPSNLIVHPSDGDSTIVDSIAVELPVDSLASPSGDSPQGDTVVVYDALVRYSSHNHYLISKALLVKDDDLDLIDQYHLASDLNGYDYQIVSLSDERSVNIDSTTRFFTVIGSDSFSAVHSGVFLDSLKNRPDLGVFARCWVNERMDDSIPTIKRLVRYSVNPY